MYTHVNLPVTGKTREKINLGIATSLSSLSVKIVRHGVDIGIINPNVEGTQVTGIFQNLI